MQALIEKPDFPMHCVFVWQAFNTLHSRRQCGFSANPLDFSAILSWFDLNGVTNLEDRRHYVRLISALDDVWLEWSREKSTNAHSTGKHRR